MLRIPITEAFVKPSVSGGVHPPTVDSPDIVSWREGRADMPRSVAPTEACLTLGIGWIGLWRTKA
jgi:hypothetical protein